ncbi:MAG: hypothetical protein KDM64_19425, partial [Verrucomicrobiae bacterium]|nr:hypothetical protein [Verrucomicrobiae bacterium]
TTTIAQSGGTDTLITISGGFESVLLGTITESLTINGEDGENDTITVTGVGTNFAGGLTINGGTGTDAVNLNGSVTLGGALAVTSESISLGAPSINSTGFDQTYTGAVALTSGVALTADDVFFSSTVNLGANALSVSVTGTAGGASGVVSGAGGSLTKLGNGSFSLGSANTYTGGTTVGSGATGGGSLRISNSNALGIGGIGVTGTGSTVDLAATLISVGNTLTIADGGDNKVLTNSGGGVTTWSGNIIIQETTTGNFDV